MSVIADWSPPQHTTLSSGHWKHSTAETISNGGRNTMYKVKLYWTQPNLWTRSGRQEMSDWSQTPEHGEVMFCTLSVEEVQVT